MAKITEREIKNCLDNLIPFIGSSTKAVLNKNVYEVYSYDTLIYSSSGYFDNQKYSGTTSKIQNMCIEAYSLNSGVKKRD